MCFSRMPHYTVGPKARRPVGVWLCLHVLSVFENTDLGIMYRLLMNNVAILGEKHSEGYFLHAIRLPIRESNMVR